MSDLISRQVAIDVEGIDEQIRCEMCRNPIHTDRGCDGNCKYDDKLYERIIQILGERIKPLPEPRKGKWIGYNADDKDWQRDDGSPIFMNCSECHGFVINNTASSWNFCPNCGSYNGGEQTG